jgi:periplasmic protein CpxP/Spy
MNSNMYKIGFFILLVVNMALVVFLALGPKRPPQAQGIKDEISRELDFTKEQRAQYDEMAMTHREKVSDIEKRERALVKSFFDQLELENSSTEREKLLNEILALNREKIMITYTHFEELKAICNQEQKIMFDKVISRIIPVLTNSSERPMNPDRPPF